MTFLADPDPLVLLKKVTTYSSTLTSAGTSVTVALPAGVVDGEVLVVFIAAAGSATGLTGVPTMPSGWTSLVNNNVSGNNCNVYKKIYAVADGGNITVTFPASSNWCYNIAIFNMVNVDYANVVAGTAFKGSTTASDTSTSIPAVSTTKTKMPVLSLCSNFTVDWNITNTWPSAYQELTDMFVAASGTNRRNSQSTALGYYDPISSTGTLVAGHSNSCVCRFGVSILLPPAK